MLDKILNSIYVAIVLDIFGGVTLALGASVGLIYLSLKSETKSERSYTLTSWLLIGLIQVLLAMLGIYAGWIAALSFWIVYGCLAVQTFIPKLNFWITSGSSATHICAFVIMTINSILFLCYQFGYYSTLTSTH